MKDSRTEWFRILCRKVTGIRAYWDGQKLYSKAEKQLKAPASFLKGLPSTPLDGHIHLPGGGLQDLMKITSLLDGDWNQLRFEVLDLPNSNDLLLDRIEQLRKLELPPFTQVAVTVKCLGNDFVEQQRKELDVDALYARNPQSRYGEGLIQIEVN